VSIVPVWDSQLAEVGFIKGLVGTTCSASCPCTMGRKEGEGVLPKGWEGVWSGGSGTHKKEATRNGLTWRKNARSSRAAQDV
jgi:hypothetical protein